MHLDFLFDLFRRTADREAVVFRDETVTYRELHDLCMQWSDWLERHEVAPGQVVALSGDYAPNTIALLLALAQRNAIVLQAGLATGHKLDEILEVGQAEVVIDITPEGIASLRRTGAGATHPLYDGLRRDERPGLVLFSSGSTGKSKAVVHAVARLMTKYRRRGRDLRTLAFLLFDHIGGIDTLFYCLSNGSCIVVVEHRDPATVCAAVERYKVQVLPVAPT